MNMIVAYDIANPRRLARIAKIMKDYGKRVQKSVFEVDLTENRFQEMKGRAERTMNLGEDGVKYIHYATGARIFSLSWDVVHHLMRRVSC